MEKEEMHNNMLTEISKKYQKVREILKEHEAIIDLNVSREKRCETIEILNEMVIELNAIMTSLTEPHSLHETAMLAIIHLNLGILYSETDEMSAVEEQFTTCINLLKDRELEPKAILPTISALNQMGIYYSGCELAKAKVALEKAEKLYINFTENIRLSPVNMAVTMGIENTEKELNAEYVLERLHTLTLYYLAQVYNALDDKEKFAAYCQRTLNKQLSQDVTMHNLDYIDWALNAATISQYYIEQDNFSQARYLLAAASCILQKYHDTIVTKDSKTEIDNDAAEDESYQRAFADVARCWAKYGIILLSASKEKMLKDAEGESESETAESSIYVKFMEIEPELKIVTSQITDQYLLNFNDARLVFLNVQKWLEKAKVYYALKYRASDYTRIIQDTSQVYRYLTSYEEDKDRQAKMHKRRIDILEDVLDELNPQPYRNICQEIWIELGETYSDILDIKIDRLQESKEKSTDRMITKINHLAKNSIKYFRLYLNSLKMSKSSDGTECFPDNQLYQALYSYFHIGRLYNKIITSETPLKIENMQKSLDAYRFVVDYYDKHPKKVEELQKHEFISLCREFVELLPLTLRKLRS